MHLCFRMILWKCFHVEHILILPRNLIAKTHPFVWMELGNSIELRFRIINGSRGMEKNRLIYIPTIRLHYEQWQWQCFSIHFKIPNLFTFCIEFKIENMLETKFFSNNNKDIFISVHIVYNICIVCVS